MLLTASYCSIFTHTLSCIHTDNALPLNLPMPACLYH